ncbi:hypothetical protein J4471_00835 [Candidatus Woesearchaeota archaeon]|nr:hypothetical protein [Candidatus Woesearchaeota archaeon]
MAEEKVYYGYIAWSYKACPSLEFFNDRADYQRRLDILELSSGRILKNEWCNQGLRKSEIEKICEGKMASAIMNEWF